MDQPGEDEVAQVEPTPTPDVREAGDEGPRPVPIDATPAPVAERDDGGGISGNWFIPIVILGIIAASLLIRGGWRLPGRAHIRPKEEPD